MYNLKKTQNCPQCFALFVQPLRRNKNTSKFLARWQVSGRNLNQPHRERAYSELYNVVFISSEFSNWWGNISAAHNQCVILNLIKLPRLCVKLAHVWL